MEEQKRTVAVIGGGLVGCLTACMMAKLGWHVDVYEARDDLRKSASASRARSINLAFSARGTESVRTIDPALCDRLMQGVIPMKGRMIHYLGGTQASQPYGIAGECINSIDRELLNKHLLDEIDGYPNISVHFHHKLLRADFDNQKLTFEVEDGRRADVAAHLTIGADGAYSKVREQIMRVVRMQFEQEYIDHAYMELSMPPGRDSETGAPKPLLDPNHLHIWPRHHFMLIALPNKDTSFTCTLFAPFSTFDRLPPPETSEQERAILQFFKEQFPDALPHIGEKELIRCFKEHPRGSLITIRADPYHYRDRAIIIGDAAHCMVPFYGQGMNCGFEDIRVLRSLLLKHSIQTVPTSSTDPALVAALDEYSSSRHKDLLSITRMTKRNYIEMRSSVATLGYKARKWLDATLANMPLFRNRWMPLYTMVTFRDDIRYSDAEAREARQTNVVAWAVRIGGLGVTAATVAVGLRAWQMSRR